MDNYEQEYHLIEDDTVRTKPKRIINRRLKRIIKYVVILSLIILISGTGVYLYNNREEKVNLVFIKGESRKDPYGLELNKNILDGIYCMGFDNNPKAKVEDWTLYTPPCPYLHPVHYPDSIINPKCDESSIQLMNYNNEDGAGLPYSLHLHSIKNQLNEWKKWEKKGLNNTLYSYKGVEELVKNDEYYPFDYGYTGEDTSKIDDSEYYTNVVKSRMDEVPDPRRRRLFSFILFNSEYDLLDLYLSEYYEIFDYFVIYESNTTFTGIPKPLYFTRALLETDRYDRFKDKLIPLPLRIEVNEDDGRGYAFPREHVARRQVVAEGLKSVQARHGDLFMHGDLDEMVKPHVIARLKKCGGWEHLQAGIGGGPKSFKDGNVQSYLVDNNNLNVATNGWGVYRVDYEKDLSIGFLSWFHEYSFNLLQNKTVGTIYHPNLAIFDARRSLGQINERMNKYPKDVRKRGEYDDPLSDPNFNPYQGYEYTDNTNDRKTGKGFLGEFVRFATSLDISKMKSGRKPVFYNGSWHLSSFLPTIEQLYNKVSSYSHFSDFHIDGEEAIKKDIISRIKEHVYIFGERKKYDENEPVIPESYIKGYPYNFNAKYWDKNLKNNGTDQEFKDYIYLINHEIPTHVWKNPICYSFMIDRDYGIDKKLWWQVIPKDQWKTVRLETLDKSLIDELTPSIITESFKKEMLEEMAKETVLKN